MAEIFAQIAAGFRQLQVEFAVRRHVKSLPLHKDLLVVRTWQQRLQRAADDHHLFRLAGGKGVLPRFHDANAGTARAGGIESNGLYFP